MDDVAFPQSSAVARDGFPSRSFDTRVIKDDMNSTCQISCSADIL